MTQAELIALDDLVDARSKMVVARLMLHYRTEKEGRLVNATVAACQALQRLAQESGLTVTNDQAWARVAFPGTTRPGSY